MKTKHKNYKHILIFFMISILSLTFIYILIYRNDLIFASKEYLITKEKIDFIGKNFNDDFKTINLESKDIDFNNNLILVNKKNSIDNIKVHENLIEYKNTGFLVDKNLLSPLDELISYSRSKTEDNLFIMSSFRTDKEQENLYLNDKKHAQKPGQSEHETGLALDFYTNYLAGRNILKSNVGKLLYKESYKYGFILRYPLFKKHITSISYEPWHFRYIGKPHAEIIYKKNLTLEEYHNILKKYDYFIFENNYISYQKKGDSNIKILKNLKDISISSDNKNAFIITAKVQTN